MPFVLPDSRSNGQTIDQTWFNTIRTALSNLNTRFNDNFEAKTLYLPLVWYGDANHQTLPIDGAIQTIIKNDLLILDCELFVPTAGSAGTLEIDIEYKDGAAAWQSIFSTKPSILYSAGSLASSTNGVVDTLYDELDTGFMLRMNIDQYQTNLEGFYAMLTCTQRSLSGV
jgi:hypothetical protein